MKETPKAIEWPSVQIGAETFTFRYSYSSNYLLAKWGNAEVPATNIELAAAMAGRFDAKGRWKSAGFANPVELADLISEADRPAETGTAVINAVTDALKKAFPGLDLARTPVQPGTAETAETKTEYYGSGPSEPQEAA